MVLTPEFTDGRGASSTQSRQNDAGRDSTPGLTVIALLLALILGFSAADLNRQPTVAGDQLNSAESQTVMDGRGKWAGYLD